MVSAFTKGHGKLIFLTLLLIGFPLSGSVFWMRGQVQKTLPTSRSIERELTLCPRFQLARRSVSPTCAAAFQMPDGTPLCFSHLQWRRYLHSPSQSMCGNFHVKEKYFSPMEPRPFHSKKIMSRIYVQKTLSHTPPSLFENIKKKIELIREGLSERFRTVDILGIVRGLILYEKTTDQTPEALLKLLGFVHLYTETGIHLFILFFWIEKIFFFLSSRCFFSLQTRWKTARFSAWVMIIFTWILTGCRVGLLRPLGILVLKKNAHHFGFQWRIYSALFLSLFWDVVFFLFQGLFYQNWSYAPGRLYYGLAVGGGLCFWDWAQKLKCLQKYPSWMQSVFTHSALSFGSWIGPATLELYEWRWAALGTPILNILSVPVVCTFFYPFLFFCLGVGYFAPALCDSFLNIGILFVNEWILFLAQGVLNLGGIFSVQGSLPGFLLAAMASSFTILLIHSKQVRVLFFQPTRLFFITFLGFSFLFLEFPHKKPVFEKKAMKIIQLDVGQGDGALILYNDGTKGMVDVGSFRHGSVEYWLKVFAYYSILHLDFIVLSHLDEDHAGGVFHLLKFMDVKKIYTSQAEIQSQRGQVFQKKLTPFSVQLKRIQGLKTPYFGFLEAISSQKRNEQMLSFLIPLEGNKFFLTAGDLHSTHEKRVLKWLKTFSPAMPEIKIYKISHHGSRFSNSEGFLKAIMPKESWLSSGMGNQYRHPHAEVLKRFEKLKLKLERTDLSGSLVYESN